jgi:hypothetical protein
MVSAATRVAAVIGDPVRHSLSPAIHNAAFAATGLDWVYVAFEVPAGRGAEAVRAMDVLGIDGLSVTMPHKADVVGAVDDLAPAAAALLMQSSQRTDDTTCFTKAALIASGSDNAWPVVLENTVNLGAKNGTDSRKPANAARAGSIKRE